MNARQRIMGLLVLGTLVLQSTVIMAEDFVPAGRASVRSGAMYQPATITEEGTDVIRTAAQADVPGGERKPGPSDPQVIEKVMRIIAEYFNLPVTEIKPDTDLLRDLHADMMDAHDVLTMACEAHGVSVPQRSDLTTAQAIAAYVHEARQAAEALRGAPIPAARGQTSEAPAPEARIYTQKVFYATNREPTGGLDPYQYYSGQRATGQQKIRYGVCEVTIPVSVHKRGRLEGGLFGFADDPKKHIVLKGIDPMDWGTFLRALNKRLSQPSEKKGWPHDAFVFLHGYNVTFAQAARRTAQIAYDFGFDGAPIMFSWPSEGGVLGFAKYISDREDVEWSVPHIERFLQDLVRQSKARRLHLIAHSMGNQGLIRVMHAIALGRGPNQPPLFENVILAAPDFDAQAFTEQIAPRITSLAKRWTLYASDNDQALKVSSGLAVRRLGLPVSIATGVDTIDTSGIEGGVAPWNLPEIHSYYASKLRVITDLIGVLNGLSPDRRNLLHGVRGGLSYWVLKPN